MAMTTTIGNRLDRRTAILRAAREVLAAKGLEATRISEIVARAGVAQGTFYLYFPSKTSLVLALTEDMKAETMVAIQGVLETATSFADIVADGVRATLLVMGRYRDVLGLIHSRFAMSETADICEEMDKPFYGFVSAMIRQAQEAGVISHTVEPDIAARLVVGLIEYAAHECYVMQPQAPIEAYINEVTRFIQSALGVA